MGYLLGEILICLILAALVGALVAWFLKKLRTRSRENELLDDLKRTHAKLDAAEGELRRQEVSLGDLQTDLDKQAQELQDRSEELAAVEATLSQKEDKMVGLEAELARLRDEKQVEIASLREHIGTLEPLQGQLDESQAERNRLQGELQALTDQMQTEVQQLHADTSDRDTTIEQLSTQLADCRANAERLEQEFASLRSSSEQDTTALPQHVDDSEFPETEPRPAAASPLFDRPAEVDDLKEIWGIGPKLEKTLNRLGITSFEQIARFTTDDIERVSDALDFFPGRIVRDGWVEGAAKAYHNKYGRKLS